MAVALGLIEGFEAYADAAHLFAMAHVVGGNVGGGVSFTMGQTGRIEGFSALGPSTEEKEVIYAADAHGGTVADTYMISVGIKPTLAGTRRFFSFMDDNDVRHVNIEVTTAGAIVARNGDGTSLGSTAVGLLRAGIWSTVEIKVVVHDTLGKVEVKIDTTQVLNLTTEDTRNGGVAEVARVAFSPEGNIDDVVGFTAATADALPGAHRVAPLLPASDSAVAFTRSAGAVNAELLDETPPDDDVTFVESATPTDVDRLVLSNYSGSGTVAGVRKMIYARVTDIGVRKLQFSELDGATNRDGATFQLFTGFQWFDEVDIAKPTGGAYTQAAINSMRWGYRLDT